MDYKDQIIAIRNKITSASETATAEELVYLAGALDKIAEKATIVDIVDAGTDATNQVEAKRVQSLNEVEVLRVKSLENVEALRVQSLDDVESKRVQSLEDLEDFANGEFKTINGETIVGVGDITVNASGIIEPLARGAITLGKYFTDLVFDNTSTYGHLIRRTVGVPTDVAQFGLFQGARKIAGNGCKANLLPFRVNADNTVTVGTPVTVWDNTSSTTQEFSTMSFHTDDKSGGFYYAGNIPFPGNASHIMGYGRGRLTETNNGDSFWNSGTDTTSGAHDHNGFYSGVPIAGGTGFVGVNAGYSQSDSRTRQHFINFTNTASPSISVINPSASASNSPVMNLMLQDNSDTSNTPIVGISHWRNSSNYVVARVFNSAGSYNDYASTSDWGAYRSGAFLGFALSTGKVLVYHGGITCLYTAYNSRTDVTSTAGGVAPFQTSADWSFSMIEPDGVDSWIMLVNTNNAMTISKWTINPTTFQWTQNWVKGVYDMETTSYKKLNILPNNRIMVSTGMSNGIFTYKIFERPTEI